MKLIIAATIIVALFSSVYCDEENSQKQKIVNQYVKDVQYYEEILEKIGVTIEAAREYFNSVQNQYEDLVVGINNLEKHLQPFLVEMQKADQTYVKDLKNKENAQEAATIANDNYKKAKKDLDDAMKSKDEEEIEFATREYAKYSAEQIKTTEKLKKAKQALEKSKFELDEIKTTVKVTQEALDKAILEKEKLQQKVADAKAGFVAKVEKQAAVETEFEKVKDEFKRKTQGIDTSGSFGNAGSIVMYGRMKQIVKLFCSLLTGAVAAGLIL